MKLTPSIFLSGFLVSFGAAAQPAPPLPPMVETGSRLSGITVPPGFTVEVAAESPLIQHPIMAGFDDRGRLFVSETDGRNLKNGELDEQTPNHITMLEDMNGDGRYDKATKFADKMTFPQGALWHQGALYVCSPPGLWRLEDTNDDGVADKREQIVTGFAYTGNAADVHGPFLHPNGRLYWCHGRKGHEVYQRDGKTLVSKNKGARIWSCNPDGSDVQVHAGGGMDNPTELVILPQGDILGTVNLFYGRPRGDVLVHWIYGGAYPRYDQQSVIDEFRRTGDLLHEIVNYGHVAVSGATQYRSGTFGEEYRDNIFVTFFNTHKVMRTILEPQGSTFTSRTEEFFTATDENFHCTDILEDADGSLLIVDTGGWFRLGCPTSQIAKPEFAGAIYRVSKVDAAKSNDPRGAKMNWASASPKALANLLDDPRFAVRDRAVAELGKRSASDSRSVRHELAERGSEQSRLSLAWLAGKLDDAKGVKIAMNDKAPVVRQAAVQAAFMLRGKDAVGSLKTMLKSDAPAVRRETAIALGRIGDPAAAPALLTALGQSDIDRMLEHSLIYALIELGTRDLTLESFAAANTADLKRRTLIALDQMDGVRLESEFVIPLLDSDDHGLQGAALEIVARNPNWSPQIVGLFNDWVAAGRLPENRARAMASILPKFLSQSAVSEFVGIMLVLRNPGADLHSVALDALTASSGAKLNPSWEPALMANLIRNDDDLAARTIDAIAPLRSPKFNDTLRKLSEDETRPSLLRVKALTAISGKAGRLSDKAFALLAELLTPEAPSKHRGEAARMFGKALLTKPQLLKLTEHLPQAGPMELPLMIDAFMKSRDADVGKAFVASVSDSSGLGNLNVPELARMLTRYPPEINDMAKPMIQRLAAAKEQEAERLEATLESLQEGDPLAGKAVFHAQKTMCVVCHRIGDQGGRVGPDLSRVGRIRTERDLLESILFPSSSIARDFESYSIDTRDDESYVGVVLTDSAETLEIANAAGLPVRIARKNVAEMKASPISLMPQGLDQAMSKKELSDLIAYLKSLQ